MQAECDSEKGGKKVNNENESSKDIKDWFGIGLEAPRLSRSERFKNWVKRNLVNVLLRLLLAFAITYVVNCLVSEFSNDLTTLFFTGVTAGYCVFQVFE